MTLPGSQASSVYRNHTKVNGQMIFIDVWVLKSCCGEFDFNLTYCDGIKEKINTLDDYNK